MSRFGERLRNERESKGLTLEQVCASTRISTRFLQAIENEQFDQLPGGLFNVSFIRQYAREIGLNEDEIAAQFEEIAPPKEMKLEEQLSSTDFPETATQLAAHRIAEEVSYFYGRRKTVLSGFVAACLVVAAGALYSTWFPKGTDSATASVSPSTQSPSPSRVEGDTVTASHLISETDGSTSAEPLQVQLRVVEKVWVRALADGERVLERTLSAGDQRSIGAHQSVKLLVGNAGGLSIELNGEEMPSIGPRGRVRRVLLTSSGMEVIRPPKKSSSDEVSTTTPSNSPSTPEPDSSTVLARAEP